MRGLKDREEKGFFFVKKKQKTFIRRGTGVGAAGAQWSESFFVLFFKKERLPS
ncbi:MAG: hypothetical protein PHI71_12390 [Acidiphilium sp.]|nr:hypothetical protein [Acidiphilium sp.]